MSYTPSDPTKDKEPKLNRSLQKKWLPEKTDGHKQQLAKESEIMARKRLLEGPSECEKTRPTNSEGYEISTNFILYLQRQQHHKQDANSCS